jgi:formylglycine-generating enzyme required for sulfatase activity
MATIFLSHASRDDHLARQLEGWLAAEGFEDLFVDHSDIRGGDKWTEELRRAKGAARVVLCLVTPDWLASDECFGEFNHAWYAGQRIVPLLTANDAALDEVQTKRLGRVLGEDQGFDLSPALIDGRLDLNAVPAIAEPLRAGLRAAGALAKIGLDPEVFEVDREIRPSPFPGLQSFGDTDADAAIFYGRSPEIARCLEDLREMRASGVRRPYGILGASGSGKSSLLKAGVLPRLRRERGWLVLRSFRPGVDPLLNFAEAIAFSFAEHGEKRAPGTLRDNLRTTWDWVEKQDGFATDGGLNKLRQMLETEVFGPLRGRANRLGATVLIPLDQAEELARAEGQGADVLCDYLRAALLQAPSADGTEALASGVMITLTARSDSLPELQAARRFAGLDARCADIRPVPVHRFDDAIEKPAVRYGVKIEPGIVEAMIEDAPVADALPLFAFALENLWRQYHETKLLRRADYDALGGLDGLIDRAAERALQGIRPGEDRSVGDQVPKEREHLAARTFVPSLAQVNETGTLIRRVAPLDRFDVQARKLLEHFDQWRLVVTKQAGDGGGSTVEVAHEAIFRGWARFQRWLEPARARLEAVRGLEVAASVWDRHGRRRAYLDHRGRRLQEARALMDHADFQKEIGQMERAYVAAALRAQDHRRNAIGAALAVVAAVAYGSWWTAERGLRVASGLVAVKAGLISFVEPEMVEIEGGEFLMGSTEVERQRAVDQGAQPEWVEVEKPQHRVEIEHAFAIGKYEVTFDEWDVCVADGGCGHKPSDEGWGRGKRPVINVNWRDAKAYVEWLSIVAGAPYRLLSEAEWEYAARAGSESAYWWGDEAGSNNANCDGCVSGWDNERTAPVGSFAANEFGLHDMAGNVWEWVEDCWNYSYEGAPNDGLPWLEGNCSFRVSRGGSWDIGPSEVRSATRYGVGTDMRFGRSGFRIARTLSRTKSVTP